ncbi:MAG: peptide ABC transporter substrate-binding protein [Chloroflexi bacterium]|nr:peptide ABC transporter substrate-binding protein [Chloroflexota bacterium]
MSDDRNQDAFSTQIKPDNPASDDGWVDDPPTTELPKAAVQAELAKRAADEVISEDLEPAPQPTSEGWFQSMPWQTPVLLAGVLLAVSAIFLWLTWGRERQPDQPVLVFRETTTYSEAIVGEPLFVNPLLASSQADRDLSRLVYSGLTRVDEFGLPVPDLAESWEVSDDGLVYTFTLRDDASWHDGEPLTADDVAFTMRLLRDPDFPGPADLGAFWRTVESYARDDLTLEFILTQPLAAFPEYAGIGILPEHWLVGVEAADLAAQPFNLDPIGTGPLDWAGLVEDDGQSTVLLRPYGDFYDRERRVELDQLEFTFYEDPADAFAALGPEVLSYGGLSEVQLQAALQSPNLNVYSARLPVYGAVIFNQQAGQRLPYFQDEAVRRALLLSLNHNQLIGEELGRVAAPTLSPMLPGTWAYNPWLPPRTYDPEQAGALLDEAGWMLENGLRGREGVRLSFALLVANDTASEALGRAIADSWDALGVDVRLVSVRPDVLVERLEDRAFDAALVEFGQGRFADPDPYPFWHQTQIDGGQNFSGLTDGDIGEAMEIARRDPNGVRRAEMYYRFQELFIERGAAIVLYNPLYHYAVSCQVANVQISLTTGPADRFSYLTDWRLLTPDEASAACAP